MRVIGALLLAVAIVGAVATLWTLWRAAGAEVDYCPDGGDCISALVITIPALLLAVVAGGVGLALVRRAGR
jgi:hypothetical protein